MTVLPTDTTARPGPLRVGPLEVWPPVVLAPMAGVTDAAYRRVCRRFGGGLYVSEMVNARGLVEGGTRSWELAAFDPDETPRSIQLYGTDPATVGAAVARLVGEGRVDHVDLNVGCPARKVTRHGGGAGLAARPHLLAALVAAAVRAAGPVPVTVKMRLGLDAERLTYLEAGRVAEDQGAAGVALHGRTAEQHYAGSADWAAIGRLKAEVRTIPVLGNGDVWTAADALRMIAETGCDGVVVGRACLGRPWLFGELDAAFAGRPIPAPPPLGLVVDTVAEHAALLAQRLGEARGLRDLRKHLGWYLAGYPVGGDARRALMGATSLAGLRRLLDGLDRTVLAPPGSERLPRGRQDGPHRVVLPEGWLDPRADAPPAAGAEPAVSGG